MNALHELQQAFAADLVSGDMRQMRGIILDDRLSAARRLNVYRNNFLTALTEALAAIYPVVRQLVGRDFFDFVADRYIQEHPSRSGNLHDLGCMLPEFLNEFEAASQLPYLPDVARLESAYHAVFHAAAPPAFEPDSLVRIPAERYAVLRVDIGPACRFVCSRYPIFRIWSVNQEGHIDDQEVDLDEGPESVLIVRPDVEVELWRLDPAEAVLFSALESGRNLGEAVESTLADLGKFDLQTSIARFLSSGALIILGNQARQLPTQHPGGGEL